MHSRIFVVSAVMLLLQACTEVSEAGLTGHEKIEERRARLKEKANATPRSSKGQQISIVGRISAQALECPALKADDGRIFSLYGRTSHLKSGDRVRITGRLGGSPICPHPLILLEKVTID